MKKKEALHPYQPDVDEFGDIIVNNKVLQFSQKLTKGQVTEFFKRSDISNYKRYSVVTKPKNK